MWTNLIMEILLQHTLLLLFSCSVKSDSFETAWTITHPAPLPLGFPRQEYWSGLHFLLQGILLTHGHTCVSCIGRLILYHWATWEVSSIYMYQIITWYALNFHNILYQLYFSKSAKNTECIHHFNKKKKAKKGFDNLAGASSSTCPSLLV